MPKNKRLISRPFAAAMARQSDAHPDLWDRLAKVAVDKALRGDFAMMRELIERSDGRVAYQHEGVPDGEPIKLVITGVPRDGDDS